MRVTHRKIDEHCHLVVSSCIVVGKIGGGGRQFKLEREVVRVTVLSRARNIEITRAKDFVTVGLELIIPVIRI